jgi:hypothetical protein
LTIIIKKMNTDDDLVGVLNYRHLGFKGKRERGRK